jgi:CheY-like chemotaxis protein
MFFHRSTDHALGYQMTIESVLTTQDAAPPKIGAATPKYSAAPKYKVLLVEDNNDSVAITRAFLSDPSIHLTVSADGEQGVRAFKDSSYDLVLMDIQMPVLDGCGAALAIRRWEIENGMIPTPITALTALSNASDLAKIFASGCSNYLPKPVTKPMLLQTVRQFLGSSPRGGSTQ